LQQVLHDVAKQDQESVLYMEVEHKICAQFRNEGAMYGPRYRSYILDAVIREVRARRLFFDPEPYPTRLWITHTGDLFYKELGVFPLYDAEHPRMRYMTIKKLRKHSRILLGVANEIHRTFLEFHPEHASVDDANDLPGVTRRLCDDINHLQAQNAELELELNFEEAEKQRLLECLSL
ncbi:hypothetical protein TRAPUB_13849, partial [Trametes pubescens]